MTIALDSSSVVADHLAATFGLTNIRFHQGTPVAVRPDPVAEIWWKPDFKQFDPAKYEGLLQRVIDHLNERNAELYSTDVFCGWDPKFAIPYRFVGEYATHAYFANIMFPKNVRDDIDRETACSTMINVPSFRCVPERDGTLSEYAVIMDLRNRIGPVVGRAGYSGVVKKTMFTVINFEDGCYAKLINLDNESEPLPAYLCVAFDDRVGPCGVSTDAQSVRREPGRSCTTSTWVSPPISSASKSAASDLSRHCGPALVRRLEHPRIGETACVIAAVFPAPCRLRRRGRSGHGHAYRRGPLGRPTRTLSATTRRWRPRRPSLRGAVEVE